MARKKCNVNVFIEHPALSTNKLYAGVKKRSWHYKQFRSHVFRYLENAQIDPNVNLSGPLAFKIEVGFSSSLSDLSNAIKGIEDVLCEYFGFDDKQIVYIEMEKYLVKKGEEYMKIRINKTSRSYDRRK